MDTGYLVAAELKEHSEHSLVRAQLQQLVHAGDTFAIAPQVLAEFIHIATDPKRFTNPLPIDEARDLAKKWWTATEVNQVFPDSEALTKFFDWHQEFQLGRKRLLDTLLAATYWRAGAFSILTTNSDDFSVFAAFTWITPQTTIPSRQETPSAPDTAE